MTQAVHIIGAGLAGLGAAVRCAELGLAVHLYEASPQPGGRCRSFDDATLGRTIDNGNHLILGGNAAIFAHLAAVGAGDRLQALESSRFPFLDLATGSRWQVRPGAPMPPLWLLDPRRRVPGGRFTDYIAMRRLLHAPRSAKLTDFVDPTQPMYERFWRPLAVAVLNTEPPEASAALIGKVLAETVMKGAAASRPYFPRVSLGDTLIVPALDFLQSRGTHIAFTCRLRALVFEADRVVALNFGEEQIAVDADDRVVLAVPSWDAAELVPGLVVPIATRPIVNAHFRIEGTFALAGGEAFLGLVGGLAQWLFRRNDVISATISAADGWVDHPVEQIAARLWRDVSRAIDQPTTTQARVRIIKERRATIAQTPEEDARRPGPVTNWRNLVLAGDWTDTGLPATIEGAVRSGRLAADLVARGNP